MLHAICRCARSRLRQFIQLSLLVGCFLPLGCGDGEDRTKQERTKQERTEQDRTEKKRTKQEPPVQEHLVSVKLTGGTGTQKVVCGSFQRLFTELVAKEAEKAGEDHYEFRAFPGELLTVTLSGKADESKDEAGVLYIFRGDEKMPLVFSRQPGLVLLNDKVISVDLSDKAGAQWFARQPEAKLQTICNLLPSGDAATDMAAYVEALTRMPGSNIIAGFSGDESAKSDPAVKARMRKALIAAKPTCLFVDETGIAEDILTQLPDLTHLLIGDGEIPDLTKLKKLRFVGCFGEVTTLAPLAKLTHLQGLVLINCKGVTDFTPLRKLTRLRTLSIGETEKLTDLNVLTDMRELRSLSLVQGEESKIKSIAPIGNLTNLTELALMPVPPNVKDISPLKKLKNLKLLVAYDQHQDERQEEYDAIREALPECKIVGICMGSAWILLVVPAAVWLGVRRRRRSATGKAA